MLMEAIVGIVALIAAASLSSGDYFAINAPAEKVAQLGLQPEHLPELSRQIGERLEGRVGGAVSLAVGMSQIFARLPGLKTLVSYWYHFAIMFEALFILTTVDAGTRVARFLVQELGGRAHPKLGRADWLPGALLSTTLVCAAWGYFVWKNPVPTLWSMLGIANQLLACIALAAGTTLIVNRGRARYAWVTLLPLVFVAVATETAGFELIRDKFLPMARGPDPLQGALLTGISALVMIALVIVTAEAALRWSRTWRTGDAQLTAGENVA
jgi:carbon starvation protein